MQHSIRISEYAMQYMNFRKSNTLKHNTAYENSSKNTSLFIYSVTTAVNHQNQTVL